MDDRFVLVRVGFFRFLAAEAVGAGICLIVYLLITTSHGPSVYTSPPAKAVSAFIFVFCMFWMAYFAGWMMITRGIQLEGTRNSLVRTVVLPTRTNPFRLAIDGDLRDVEFRMKPHPHIDRVVVLTLHGSAGRLDFPLSRFIVTNDIHDRERAWQTSTQ
ncbi:MAG: hypothetical protein R2733_01865 [Acidimicrobiales bacterium]